MPFIADYKCHDCGKTWEEWQRNSQDIPTKCECGSTDIEQMPGGSITTCHDPAVKMDKLKKRSAAHSIKHAKENIERIKASGKIQIK